MDVEDEEIDDDVCDSDESKSDVESDGVDWELSDSTADKFGVPWLFDSSIVFILFKLMSFSIRFSWTELPRNTI